MSEYERETRWERRLRHTFASSWSCLFFGNWRNVVLMLDLTRLEWTCCWFSALCMATLRLNAFISLELSLKNAIFWFNASKMSRMGFLPLVTIALFESPLLTMIGSCCCADWKISGDVPSKADWRCWNCCCCWDFSREAAGESTVMLMAALTWLGGGDCK